MPKKEVTSMDVLGIVLMLIVLGTILYWLAVGVAIAGVVIWILWPVLVGLVVGVWIRQRRGACNSCWYCGASVYGNA